MLANNSVHASVSPSKKFLKHLTYFQGNLYKRSGTINNSTSINLNFCPSVISTRQPFKTPAVEKSYRLASDVVSFAE